jgi:glycosyltransferase involved in cell wall biosynthesis
VQESKAIIYIAPALKKFIHLKPKGKLILFANNSHVLERNSRMKESAAKWGLPVESLGPEKDFLESYKASDYIMLAGNSEVYQTFLSQGVPMEKLKPWHNSIDTSVYTPNEKKYEQFTFVHWSSELGLRKGLPALLDAWKKWNNPKARLMLLGIVTKAGRKLMYKRNFFGWPKKSLPKNVELYGSKKGFPAQDPFVKEVLGKSHVGVFPTLEDNQPASVMEMASAGLPVILTREAGFNNDDTWSYGVKADDSQDMVKALEKAYNDNDRQQKGKAAREFVIKNHSWDDFRLGFSRFLKEVL